MLSIISFVFDPNNSIVSLLLIMILMCFFVCVIPNGTSMVGPSFSHPVAVVTQSNWQVGKSNYYSLTKSISLVATMIPLIWSIYFWSIYDASGNVLQMVVCFERMHISFGMDGSSLSLTILTAGLFPICIMLMRTWKGLLVFLQLEILIYAALNVLDLLGFYILFESSLILLFLLIGRTKYGNIEAAYKIVLYTMFGSLILLPMIFIMYALGGSTSLIYLMCNFSNSNCNISPMFDGNFTAGETLNVIYSLPERQHILGWGLLLVFAVKIPLMPVHLWLPEAHVAAPTAGSVLLAGVLLKLGGLGLIRYLIPMLPSYTASIFPMVCCVCLTTFLFTTTSTIRQIDLKKIVAYSSIGHMSMITLSIFSMSEYSAFNSTFMMVAHGLVSPCLFLLVGYLYDRFHTKFVIYYTGLGSHMPIFSLLFFICTLANLSFPLFPNFIGEFLCLTSIFSVHSLFAYIFCVSQVLGTVAAFWAFNRILMGYPTVIPTWIDGTSLAGSDDASASKAELFKSKTKWTTPLSRMEFYIVLPLIVSILWLGCKPMG